MHSGVARAVGLTLISALAAYSGGCTPTRGVNVHNATGEMVSVEMLAHEPSGEVVTYGKAVVDIDETFLNTMVEPVRGQTLRARFRLGSQTLADENWVMINLPKDTTRYYSLQVIDGRLKALPQLRGRPESNTSTQ